MKTSIKRNKIALFIMAVVLMISMLAPAASAADYSPYLANAVNGRILTPDMTGDSCNWIEIAQHSGYSLIVRQDFISWNFYGFRDPQWNIKAFGTNNYYSSSNVRKVINDWFNFRNYVQDALPQTAKIRNYTVANNASYLVGTTNGQNSVYDGFSSPSPYQFSFGDDVAFALSSTEAINFMSTGYYAKFSLPSPYYDYNEGTSIAYANFKKLNKPMGNYPVSYNMWLRSPGDTTGYAGALIFGGAVSAPGRVSQLPINALYDYGLIYPALWVTPGIFAGAFHPITVNYYKDSISGGNLIASIPLSPQAANSYIDVNLYQHAPAGYITPGERSGDTYVKPGQNTVNVLYKKAAQKATVYVYYYKDMIAGTPLGTDIVSFDVPIGSPLPLSSIDATKFAPAGYVVPGTLSGDTIAREPLSFVFVTYTKTVGQRDVNVLHMIQRSMYQPTVYDLYQFDTFKASDNTVIYSSGKQMYIPGYIYQDATPPTLIVSEYNTTIIIRYRLY